MELNHFGHEHLLVLSEDSSAYYRCSACDVDIVGLCYCCEECRNVLHKWCADLPRELTYHQLHLHHPLLLEFPKIYGKEEEKENSVCKSCEDPIDGGSIDSLDTFYVQPFRRCIYRCAQCSFNLHADCAWLSKQLMLEVDDQDSYPVGKKTCSTFKHMNVDHDGPTKTYTCNFCHEYGYGSRFVALIEYPGHEPLKMANNSWHTQCTMLPKLVKHERHLHEFTLHPPIEKDLNYDECYCDACEQDRDPKAWVYYCESCEFAAHLNCGIARLDRPKQLILSTHPVYDSHKKKKS